MRDELELGRRLGEQMKDLAPPEWKSVPLNPLTDLPTERLPEGLRPLPEVRMESPEMKAARARLAELNSQAELLTRDLAVAVDAGDADMILEVRRAQEELVVRLWAAEREAATAALTHFHAERARMETYVDHYGFPLEELRARIRELEEQVPPLSEAVAYVQAALSTLDQRAGRHERDLARLAQGPVTLTGGAR